MAGEKQIYGGGGAVGASGVGSFLVQNQMVSSTSFLGSRSILSFDGGSGGKRSSNSVYQSIGQGVENMDDEELEEYYFRQPEKKRRLTAEQVLYLEKNFEDENKLEPERKVELAKELGLQPRQIAVWFQNRRARWKTKHLEKEYDVLQASYDSLKADYDNLLKEKESLKAEVVHITEKLLMSDKEKDLSPKLSHSSSLTTTPPLKESSYSVSEDEVSKASASGLMSDALYSDSSRYADGVHSSSLLELGDSSYAFEQDQSDLSQDEEEVKGKNLFTASYMFPGPEDDSSDYCDAANSSFYDFPVDDQALDFWLN